MSDRVDVGAALAVTTRTNERMSCCAMSMTSPRSRLPLLGVSVGTVKSQSRDALAACTLLTPSDFGVPAGRTTTETKPFPGGP